MTSLLKNHFSRLVVLQIILWSQVVFAEQFTNEVVLSNNEAFAVSIQPRDGKTVVGNYHQWLVHVVDSAGNAVEGLQIGISGGMKAHGHGLPSNPVVTEYLGNGNYLVEGMLFNMAGQWTIQLLIRTPEITDSVEFDFNLTF